jgi:endonuclease-3
MGVKRARSVSPTTLSKAAATATASDSPQKSKKLKLLATYSAESPFPEWARPTPEEAHAVHEVLCAAHPEYAAKRVAPREENNAAKTCGKGMFCICSKRVSHVLIGCAVPNVLESLIGTILSQNTSNHNSTTAKTSLDNTFGRNEFAKIAAAPKKDVVEALKMGGLANKKAGVIQKLLADVKERHGDYSLQYLANSTDEEVMNGSWPSLPRFSHLD